MRIAVIGAGVAGLAAAALLARAGHAVAVLERAEAPRPIGAGLLLQPPGARILGLLGARAPVEQAAARITRLHATTPSGRTILRLDYADLAPDAHGLGVARPLLWSALMAACRGAGARVVPGVEVTAVTGGTEGGQEQADPVVVRAAGQPDRHYDLAVIAAGTHAAALVPRGTAGERYVSRVYPWGCLWASVVLPPAWPRDALLQRCVGTRVMIGVLPTGTDGGHATGALYWSIRNDAVPAWRERPIAAWRDDLARAWPEAGEVAAGVEREDLAHATYRDVWADPPFAGRIVVLGDAAHGTSPQLGQGATQALRDALALSDALAARGPIRDRLAAYWGGRRAATAYYRQASRALTPLFQSGLPGLGPLRDLLAGPVGGLAPVRRFALATLAGAKMGWFGAEPAGVSASPPATEAAG